MPATDVISDANIVLKWFHEHGEEDTAAAHALLEHHRSRRAILYVLDLTFYEIGNALMRGHARVSAAQAATVLTALREICPTIAPDDEDFALAAELAGEHGLTLYDAAYAAVASQRDVPLVTLDRRLLDSGLAVRPDQLLAQIAQGGA